MPDPFRPDPLFIFCPGRSFSSVVSAIIGQNPDCYGLLELNIFVEDTLGASVDSFERSGRTPMVGLVRTLAQLHDGVQTEDTVDAARRWITQNRHLSGKQVMDHIQDLVGPRILVDKSPANVLRPEFMNRIIRAYPQASFIQLLRHPRSRGKSHMEAVKKQKVTQLMGWLAGGIDYEGKWTKTHQIIQDFGRQLPLGQMMRLRGEDFLRDLHLYLPQICDWLGIRSDPEAIRMMLHPEESPYSCIGPKSAAHGTNTGFLASPALDMERLSAMTDPTLDAAMDWAPDHYFSETTHLLARSYGYR